MLVLASTSPYRRELLSRLGLAVETARPDVDETPQTGEIPRALAIRLAQAKATVIAKIQPQAWIIGSDQVAELAGQPLGKPGDFSRAREQLLACSGQRVIFHTAVSLYRGHDAQMLTTCDLTCVTFREISSAEIERYLHAEQPYDCAGSFKAEGLGISLFEAIESTDPTALIGLPLIGLAKLLRQAGFALP